MNVTGGAAMGLAPVPPDNERFLIELEFVQSLANIGYLNFLARDGFFEDNKFLCYLKYLTYWKDPAYIKYIQFPQCLAFLDALNENADFRMALASPAYAEYAHQQQAAHWMFDAVLNAPDMP